MDRELNFAIENNLPTRRWKIRRIRKAFEKKILRLYREEEKLYDIIRNMEYEKLEKPIQRGFKRHFELIDSIKKKKESAFFQTILNKINSVEYSPNKQFRKIRKKRVRKKKYKRVKTGEQKLLDLKEKNFSNELNDHERIYFYPIEYYSCKHRRWLTKYRFTEPWLFQLKIRSNFLTHIQKHNWEAEKRCNEINDYLDKNRLRVKIEKIRSYYNDYYSREFSDSYIKEKWGNPLKNKRLVDIMSEYKEEKQLLWQYEQKN